MLRKEAAKKIRTELKDQGISNKQVGVASKQIGLEDCINIIIKDPEINYGIARKLADKYKIIRRDKRSGEILGGNNLFIDVYTAF